MAEIDLAFIPRQLEPLVNDMAGLKDDMVSWRGWRPTAKRLRDGRAGHKT